MNELMLSLSFLFSFAILAIGCSLFTAQGSPSFGYHGECEKIEMEDKWLIVVVIFVHKTRKKNLGRTFHGKCQHDFRAPDCAVAQVATKDEYFLR